MSVVSRIDSAILHMSACVSISDRLCRFYIPFNRPIQHVVYVKLIYRIGSTHSIGLSSVPPFLRTIPHVGGLCIDIVSGMIDRFCHFYIPFNRSFRHFCIPFNRSIIDSAVFAHHSIGLYSMCEWSLYRHRVWCDLTNVGIKSFRHFCIPFYRSVIIPTFLHMSAAYTDHSAVFAHVCHRFHCLG